MKDLNDYEILHFTVYFAVQEDLNFILITEVSKLGKQIFFFQSHLP